MSKHRSKTMINDLTDDLRQVLQALEEVGAETECPSAVLEDLSVAHHRVQCALDVIMHRGTHVRLLPPVKRF